MARRRQKPIAGMRVLITGGSSGIGLACARELTGAGARVAVLSRGGPALAEAAATLDPSPVVVAADVTDLPALEAAIRDAATALGGLDAVVANAGAATYGPFVDMSPDDYRRTIDTTLMGTVNTAHAALPLLEATGGTLVVVGSVAGRTPGPWLAPYTAAKHGVRGFTRALAVELRALGKDVRVALVAPGPVDTPFWKRSRTTDGRLPPEMRGVYGPEAVVAEITRALRSPRTERTVGGFMAAWLFFDAVAPNVALRLITPVAKLGWRRRAKRPPSPSDGLAHPAESAQVEGDLRSRGSVAGRLRNLVGIGRE